MSIDISPADTGEIARAGEETRVIPPFETTAVTPLRLPAVAAGPAEQTAFAYASNTTELPLVGDGQSGSSWTPPEWVETPGYVGRHRLTFTAWVGRLLGRRAGAR